MIAHDNCQAIIQKAIACLIKQLSRLSPKTASRKESSKNHLKTIGKPDKSQD
jgi:hypothetical protein